MKSRPYQIKDIARLRAALRKTSRVLYVLPAGGGKTHVAVAHIMARVRRGERVLFVAHRREIIIQTTRRLAEAGVSDSKIGVIMAGIQPNETAPIQVASIQTLNKRVAPRVDLVIPDEAHRAAARTYRELMAMYPDADIIGLTATPERLDGKPMRDVFDDMIIGPSPEELIALGYLARPVVYTAPEEKLPDLRGVRTSMGDFDNTGLDRAFRRVVVGDAVEHYRRHANGLSTVLFAVNIAHAKRYRDVFVRAGYRCEHIDGSTPPLVRDAIIDRLRTKKTRIVTACDVLVEGWDAPWVKCLICARPTKSLMKWLQMAGRVMRPWGNVRPVILDHAGNALRLGLPQDDQRWSLDGRPVSSAEKRGVPVCKRCPECEATMHTSCSSCESCGYAFSRSSTIHQIDGSLVEFMGFTPEQIREDRRRLEELAKVRGFKPEWVERVMVAKFGT